jgi:hypothetical protein
MKLASTVLHHLAPTKRLMAGALTPVLDLGNDGLLGSHRIERRIDAHGTPAVGFTLDTRRAVVLGKGIGVIVRKSGIAGGHSCLLLLDELREARKLARVVLLGGLLLCLLR